jgi:hypothetical protein
VETRIQVLARKVRGFTAWNMTTSSVASTPSSITHSHPNTIPLPTSSRSCPFPSSPIKSSILANQYCTHHGLGMQGSSGDKLSNSQLERDPTARSWQGSRSPHEWVTFAPSRPGILCSQNHSRSSLPNRGGSFRVFSEPVFLVGGQGYPRFGP